VPKRLIPNEIESTVALRHEAYTARNSRFRYRIWSRPEKERSNNRQFSSVIHIRFEPPSGSLMSSILYPIASSVTEQMPSIMAAH